MKLCVFGRDTDPVSAHVAVAARARGHAVVEVSLHDARVSFDGAVWRAGGHVLDEQDAFVLRRYPSPTAQLAPAGETLDGAAWWVRAKKQAERSSFAWSALVAMERSGKAVVNPLLASGPCEHKPFQLAAFIDAGLPVPKTLVTNDAALARAFVASVGEAIAKPAAGGAAAVAVDAGSDLEPARAAPVIFQERVRGRDVRVTVVAGRVVSTVAVRAAGDDVVDYRAGAAWERGDVVYEDHPLPAAAAAMCVDAARVCGHVLSGIDLKRAADGSYVLLEANAAPVYLDIEAQTGAPITATLLDHLEARVR